MTLLFSLAFAEEPATCPPATELVAAERWLRAASLDIRGVVPTPDELLEISDPDELPADLLDAWLASDEFVERAVREHRKLLWNRFDDLNLINNRVRLNGAGTETSPMWLRGRATIYRGSAIDCGDLPAVDEDGDGQWDLDEQGREGWVYVHPYWEPDPDVQVAVCAFDATEAVTSDVGSPCATNQGAGDATCGCGPDLAYCTDGPGTQAIRASIGAAMDERIAAVFRSGRPYTDLLTEDLIYVNGPLVHLYTHLAELPAGVRITEPSVDPATLPDLDFWDQDTWVAMPVHPAHAGIFTDPAFLFRFMTNRARVSRFYEGFLCQPLVAPANGIDLDGAVTLDLSTRTGCAYCHAIIEPAAAYWGRFTENGASFLDPFEYPAHDPTCASCSADSTTPCPDVCRRYYTVDPSSTELDPYVGSLMALQFRPPDQHGRVDEGPGALVASQIASGQLPTCVAQQTATSLLGRDLVVDDPLDGWTAALMGGWSYAELVRAIVTSESYRRIH